MENVGAAVTFSPGQGQASSWLQQQEQVDAHDDEQPRTKRIKCEPKSSAGSLGAAAGAVVAKDQQHKQSPATGLLSRFMWPFGGANAAPPAAAAAAAGGGGGGDGDDDDDGCANGDGCKHADTAMQDAAAPVAAQGSMRLCNAADHLDDADGAPAGNGQESGVHQRYSKRAAAVAGVAAAAAACQPRRSNRDAKPRIAYVGGLPVLKDNLYGFEGEPSVFDKELAGDWQDDVTSARHGTLLQLWLGALLTSAYCCCL